MQLDAHLLGTATALDQHPCGDDVLQAVEAERLGVQPVSAGAPCLLVVALDVLGHVVVHDEPDIGLVDSHPKRHRRDDHLHVVAKEGVLDAAALLRWKTGVVRSGGDSGRLQARCHLLDSLAAQRIDDAGVAWVRGYEALELLRRLVLLGDGVADVGPVEPGCEDGCVGEVQALPHVVARLVVGGRCERDERHRGKELG